MKLRNKKTGEIAEQVWWDNEVDELCINGNKMNFYNSLSELNEEWEDYEEPKKYWYIYGDSAQSGDVGDILEDGFRQTGNYFDTREEAEKAVEKLKAWKRLKDKGFRFNGVTPMEYFIRFTYDKPRQILDNQQYPEVAQQFNKDLDLLFGGEE